MFSLAQLRTFKTVRLRRNVMYTLLFFVHLHVSYFVFSFSLHICFLFVSQPSYLIISGNEPFLPDIWQLLFSKQKGDQTLCTLCKDISQPEHSTVPFLLQLFEWCVHSNDKLNYIGSHWGHCFAWHRVPVVLKIGTSQLLLAFFCSLFEASYRQPWVQQVLKNILLCDFNRTSLSAK